MTQPPPLARDDEAENGVIGAVLLDARALAQMPSVEVVDFADGHRRAIWTAIRNLEAKGLPVDRVTIGDELERYGRMRRLDDRDEDAGPKFRAECEVTLAEAFLRCPAPDRAVEYAAILRKHRVTRECVRTLGSLLSVAQRGSLEGDELVAEATGELMRLGEGRKTEESGIAVGRIVADECDRIATEEASGDQMPSGMPTGLSKLDDLTGGIPYAVTTLVLARPRMGKTTLAHNIAWCAAILGNDTPLLYSYEDNHQSFAQRSMAQSSGVHTERIRSRRFETSDMPMLAAARRRMLGRREVIVKAAGMSVDELIRDARARRIRGSQDGSTVGRLVFVDYVQKMPEPEGRTRNERLGVLSRKLSEWAAKDEIAVVVCSQVNRSLEHRDDNVPRLEDARDCGELEQDCKLALGLYRPALYDAPPTEEEKGKAPESLLEIHVLKNHNGRSNVWASVFWDLETHTICDSANVLRERRLMGGNDANGN